MTREPDLDRARDSGRRRDESLRSVPAGAQVSQMAPQVKMHIVEPKSYSEAQNIADKYKQGTPVIMNMSMTSPDVAKRMIDFASGLTYGLDGGLAEDLGQGLHAYPGQRRRLRRRRAAAARHGPVHDGVD